MKKVNKTSGRNALKDYSCDNPSGSWEDFRQVDQGAAYSEIQRIVLNDQGWICAYCEKDIPMDEDYKHKRRLEHFHSKSDAGEGVNWALEWQNIIGCCIGGSDADKERHKLPWNLSCDSYKDYLIRVKGA